MKVKIQKIVTHLIKVYEDLEEMGKIQNTDLHDKYEILKDHKEEMTDIEFVKKVLIKEKVLIDELMLVNLSVEDREIIIDDYIIINEYYNQIVDGYITNDK
jgi:hypothetical protein